MPGGEIEVVSGNDWSATLTGNVTRVRSGSLSGEVFAEQALR